MTKHTIELQWNKVSHVGQRNSQCAASLNTNVISCWNRVVMSALCLHSMTYFNIRRGGGNYHSNWVTKVGPGLIDGVQKDLFLFYFLHSHMFIELQFVYAAPKTNGCLTTKIKRTQVSQLRKQCNQERSILSGNTAIYVCLWMSVNRLWGANRFFFLKNKASEYSPTKLKLFDSFFERASLRIDRQGTVALVFVLVFRESGSVKVLSSFIHFFWPVPQSLLSSALRLTPCFALLSTSIVLLCI